MEYFYGRKINPEEEKKEIQNILSKYSSELPNEQLKQTIFETLTQAKECGKISIPFKVVLRKGKSPYIEIILDTKV